MSRPKLLFISPRFLFPIDSGGKIRTTGILREMKGGAFEITLLCPEPPSGNYDAQMATIADHWHYWPATEGLALKLKRAASLMSSIPIPVASDSSSAAKKLIDEQLSRDTDVAIFDFTHAAVLAAKTSTVPRILFTHNVEAEIFARHAEVASNPLMKILWRSQWKKMLRFEGDWINRFTKSVAVSERDKAFFVRDYKASNVETIPTGVDLNFFPYNYQPNTDTLVFTGSMDWLANQDGIEFFMHDVWPLISAERATTQMCIVGRAPPDWLIKKAAPLGDRWQFTGFVDDVRDYIHSARAYVIPLRVGGGTRLKVFEAMASGCPVISTKIGVEGLDIVDGEHYLNAETPAEFAAATLQVLQNDELAMRLSKAARKFVEENASNAVVARRFEQICFSAMSA